MNHWTLPHGSSWLSLVAETAGVPGAGIVRVELDASRLCGAVRAVVQVLDRRGAIVGAGSWSGEGADLSSGTTVDIGCDLATSDELEIVAWLDEAPRARRAPARSKAPSWAARTDYDPMLGARLHLDALDGTGHGAHHEATRSSVSEAA